ncbi:MAG: hypothetical protein ACD_5C00037G0008 [uncultured bacterium]|nr:MAG: hypothetical protein ACD_5C00037G0008 [uncultured bacterium]
MTTINLYQNKEDKQKKGVSFGSGGFWLSLSMVILTVIGLFGIRIYIKSVLVKNEKLGEAIAIENQSLAGVDSLQRVLDMQGRIAEINKNLEIRNSKVDRLKVTDVMDNLEKDMNSGVALTAYDFNGESNILKITFETSNFNDSARQILNLKKSPYFYDVKLGELNRIEKSIETKVDMRIKGFVK